MHLTEQSLGAPVKSYRSRMRFVCTQMTCWNEINVLSKEICMRWARFYRPIRDGVFFGFFKSDPRHYTKGSRPLGTSIQSRPQGLLVYQNVRRHIEKREDSGARLACERETYFRWSLLSRFFLDRKYVCGSQQSQARLGWVSPKIPSSFPELRSFWSASWIHDRPKGSKLWVRECKNPNFPELTRVTLLADSLLQSHF